MLHCMLSPANPQLSTAGNMTQGRVAVGCMYLTNTSSMNSLAMQMTQIHNA